MARGRQENQSGLPKYSKPMPSTAGLTSTLAERNQRPTWCGQQPYGHSGGKSIRYISTSPVPERPQLLVNRTRVKSGLTLAWGSAQ